MNKYNRFYGLQLNEAKKLYRQLSMKHHPDKGGNNDDFIKLNNEFKEYLVFKKSSQKDSLKVHEIIKDLKYSIPPDLLEQIFESRMIRLVSSGILADALEILGKNNKKVKDLEDIIRKLKQ